MLEAKDIFNDPTLTHLILNDQPLPASILEEFDFLDTSKYADQIIQIIKSHIDMHKKSTNNGSLSTGFNMALYGSWGSGKTTLLYSLKEKLKTTGYPVCFFNPWKYENTPVSTTFALLRQIEKYNISFLKNTEVILELRKNLMSIAHLGFSLIPTHPIDIKGTLEVEKMYSDSNTSNYLNWIDNIEDFSEKFQLIVNEITKKPNKPLIVFIDDLDRCTPDNALDLLQNIKNYLNVDNCIFIMGIDKEVLAKYITNKYNVDCFNGYQFLEKIFQYELNLPAENAKMEDVIQKFCEALDIKNIDVFKENFKDFSITFRSFKRIFKRLYLTKLMFQDTEKQNMFNQPNILLLIICFELWPEFELEFNKLTIDQKINLFINLRIGDIKDNLLHHKGYKLQTSAENSLHVPWKENYIIHLVNLGINTNTELKIVLKVFEVFYSIQKKYCSNGVAKPSLQTLLSAVASFN